MQKTLLASVALALLLTSCGRQEPVSEVPDSEALAAAAKAAADNAAERIEATAAENRNYVNAARGFSLTLPEGWTRNAQTSTADGVVAEDAGAGADIRVFWSANGNDKDLQQIVEAMNDQSEAVNGSFVNDNEYRGTANDGEGHNVAVRLIRKTDGSLVTATFVYPEMLSEQYQTIAQTTLDSLRVFDGTAATSAPSASPASAAPAPAGNAAE